MGAGGAGTVGAGGAGTVGAGGVGAGGGGTGDPGSVAPDSRRGTCSGLVGALQPTKTPKEITAASLEMAMSSSPDTTPILKTAVVRKADKDWCPRLATIAVLKLISR